MKITYTPETVSDLIRLREFIEQKNPQAAQHIAAELMQGITRLKTFPYKGFEVTEAPDPEAIRDLILGRYIVRYFVYEKEVHILRVWHHKEKRI
jgi:addiction module RelE/StbE family toxin